MNIQIGDMICSKRFPTYGHGIVLDRKEDKGYCVLFIHWIQVKDASWYNESYMQLHRFGETK
mgnify:FL=1